MAITTSASKVITLLGVAGTAAGASTFFGTIGMDVHNPAKMPLQIGALGFTLVSSQVITLGCWLWKKAKDNSRDASTTPLVQHNNQKTPKCCC